MPSYDVHEDTPSDFDTLSDFLPDFLADRPGRIVATIVAAVALTAAVACLIVSSDLRDAANVVGVTPMVVDHTASPDSVVCIDGTVPPNMKDLARWREVHAADNPTQGSPCPPGQTLAAG